MYDLYIWVGTKTLVTSFLLTLFFSQDKSKIEYVYLRRHGLQLVHPPQLNHSCPTNQLYHI